MTERERQVIEEIEHLLARNRDLPSTETMSRLVADIHTRLDTIETKLDNHMSEASEKLSIVDDLMRFGKVGTIVFSSIVKTIVGIGVIGGGIIAFKSWTQH